MTLTTVARVLADHLIRRRPRETYWATRVSLSRLARLISQQNRAFLIHALKDESAFLLRAIQPVQGQVRERTHAAAAWLLRAQEATPDAGVSLGYFPCDARPGWRPSYPETTGYIIPSLLEYAGRFGDGQARDRALEMAQWEIAVQMESGAVQGGPVCPPERQTPAVFNTGMVLHGWSAAYRETGERRYLEAGRRAADFLLNDQGEDGNFRTHGEFVAPGRVKAYCCLCAWPLYRFGEDARDERYKQAAIKSVEAALRLQQPNGWFANNNLSLGPSDAPLLHAIGYVLQGVLETGILAGRQDFVAAARTGTDPILARTANTGFVHGRFYADWEPAVFSACLTGSAQLAVVCYRLGEYLGEREYVAWGDRIVNFLKALQVLDSEDESINGALAGSFPIFGGYMTGGYPNWATKYLLDALMLQCRLRED